jgi:hypothetical protein
MLPTIQSPVISTADESVRTRLVRSNKGSKCPSAGDSNGMTTQSTGAGTCPRSLSLLLARARALGHTYKQEHNVLRRQFVETASDRRLLKQQN